MALFSQKVGNSYKKSPHYSGFFYSIFEYLFALRMATNIEDRSLQKCTKRVYPFTYIPYIVIGCQNAFLFFSFPFFSFYKFRFL